MKKASSSMPPERTLRKFNPGTLQTNEEIIRQFVVRNREFNTVLEVLRENLAAPSCQHVLVVAPRGRGKTMLLARLVAELRTDEMLGKHLCPMRFMEESHGIFTLADLWLEVLFQLAQECQALEPEIAQELRDTRTSLLQRWRESNLEEYALAAVLEASDQLGRKLVLMIENFQDLCQETDEDFGWKLRKTLQTEPQIMLVATATSHFKGLDDVEQPFFEMFRFVNLAPLSTCECQRLWKMASGVQTSALEIRPLEILPGGSPRFLIIMAEFALHKSLPQLMEELVHLIDDHTEFFRNSLQVLAKTERRVFLAIIDLWQASSTSEIATRARMDVRSVSALLGRLLERGALNVEGNGRKRRYVAAERLYCIYYKLRRERDEAAIVHHLINFMAAFYRKTELFEVFRILILEANVIPSIREGMVLAITDDHGFMELSRELEPVKGKQETAFAAGATLGSEGYRLLEEGKRQEAIANFNAALKCLETFPSRRERKYRARMMFFRAHTLMELGELEPALTALEMVFEHFGSSKAKNLQLILASTQFLMGIVQWKLREPEVAEATYDVLVKRYGDIEAPELQYPVALALYKQAEWKMENREYGAAALVIDELLKRFSTTKNPEIQILVASALVKKGTSKLYLGEDEEALAICVEVVERYGIDEGPDFQKETAWALATESILQANLGRAIEALSICDRLAERFGASEEPKVQFQITMALIGRYRALIQLGEYAPAVEICDEAVKRFAAYPGKDEQALTVLILVDKAKLQIYRDSEKEALLTCDDIERKLDILMVPPQSQVDRGMRLLKWQSQLVRARALQLNGRLEETYSVFDRVIAEFVPSNEFMMQALLAEVPDLIADGASESDLAQILSKDQTKSQSLAPLVCALNQSAGKSVRAPAEVLDVASDILARIEEKRRLRNLPGE